MKLSNYYLPTLRESPADATVVAHQLMARAAIFRSAGVGVFSLLPYGVALLDKVKETVRPSLFSDSLKVSTASLQNRAMWEASGRWENYGSDMYKVVDRYNRGAVLSPESEEAFLSFISGELKSYKQLPLFIYEEAKRFKDVQKPKVGLADGRERLLLEGWRFDGDQSSAAEYFAAQVKKAHELLEDWGIHYQVVEEDGATIFYAIAQDYVDEIVYANSGAYHIHSAPVAYSLPEEEEAREMEEIHTPGASTIKDLSEMINVAPARCAKAVDLNIQGNPVFVFIPGDRELNLKKLASYVDVPESEIDMLDEQSIVDMGSSPGFTGPVGLSDKARVIVDRSVSLMNNVVVGANKEDYHIKNVNFQRDYRAEIAEDLLVVEEGDMTPAKEVYTFSRGFEVMKFKKPSQYFSKTMGISYLNDAGKETPYIMTGTSVNLGACLSAIIEAHHDEAGIDFPCGISPYDVIITVVNVKKQEQLSEALALYDTLTREGISVILDDRDERAGVKFKDRDLIGTPIQVTAGKDISEGLFELKRRGGEVETISKDAVFNQIKAMLH